MSDEHVVTRERVLIENYRLEKEFHFYIAERFKRNKSILRKVSHKCLIMTTLLNSLNYLSPIMELYKSM